MYLCTESFSSCGQTNTHRHSCHIHELERKGGKGEGERRGGYTVSGDCLHPFSNPPIGPALKKRERNENGKIHTHTHTHSHSSDSPAASSSRLPSLLFPTNTKATVNITW